MRNDISGNPVLSYLRGQSLGGLLVTPATLSKMSKHLRIKKVKLAEELQRLRKNGKIRFYDQGWHLW